MIVGPHRSEAHSGTVLIGQFDWGGLLPKRNGGVQWYPRPGRQSGNASANVQGCLTARLISRAGTKVGVSDPAVLDGKAVAQQIKGTPGITGLSPLSVHSGEEVWHLNTSGCCKSNLVPTNRLITVNPSAELWLRVGAGSARRYRGKFSSTPVEE